MNDEFLIIQPSPSSLVQSLRDIGYSMESAVADVIDNSITAGAKNIQIHFSWNEGDPWLSVVDDGKGMSAPELTSAMRLGSRNPLEERDQEDLGRFGLGLKTASFSQARQLTLISKKNSELACRQWDLDLIEDDPASGWRLLVLQERALMKDIITAQLLNMIEKQGTVVLLRKLDRYDGLEKKLNAQIDFTRKHLELVFHRYLSPERGRRKVNIYLNNDPLIAFNPFNPLNNATQELPEQTIYVAGHAVRVQPYVLPHYNKTSREEYERYSGEGGYLQNQGFYVYRNRRLIIKGTWFRLIAKEELTKLLRVQVDLPNALDHLWKVDVKKSHASPPEVIRKELRTTIERIASSGKRVYRQRGERLVTNVKVPGWTRTAAEGKIIYRINQEHPLAEQIRSYIPSEHQKLFNDFLLMLESTFPTELFYSDAANNLENLENPRFDEEQMTDLLDLLGT